MADEVLEDCKDVGDGVDFAATKAAITLAEKAVEDIGKAGDGAFQAVQATLQTVDKIFTAAVLLVENGLDLVEKGGEAIITAVRSALYAYLKVSDTAAISSNIKFFRSPINDVMLVKQACSVETQGTMMLDDYVIIAYSYFMD